MKPRPPRATLTYSLLPYTTLFRSRREPHRPGEPGVSVTARRIEAPVVVALGSNRGDRGATLLAAVRELAEAPGVELTAISTLIETPALKPDENGRPHV